MLILSISYKKILTRVYGRTRQITVSFREELRKTNVELLRAHVYNRAEWLTYLYVLNQQLHVFIIAEHRRQTRTIATRLLFELVVYHRPAIRHHHHHRRHQQQQQQFIIIIVNQYVCHDSAMYSIVFGTCLLFPSSPEN